MKKIIFIIISIVLVVALGFGVYYLFFKKDVKDYGKYRTSVHIEYLEDGNEYTKGRDLIVYSIYAFSDIKFEQIKYSINNNSEVNLSNCKIGDSTSHKKYHSGAGQYYIDAGGQAILTDNLNAGDYVITFYGYDANNARYELTPKAIYFKVLPGTN